MQVSLASGSFLKTNGAKFEFGHARHRIQCGIGKQIGAACAGKMKRHEQSVHADGGRQALSCRKPSLIYLSCGHVPDRLAA